MEQTKTSYLIPGAILIAGILIAGAVIYTKKVPSGSTQQQARQNKLDPAAGGYALGKPDAPVTVVEFADYQCPFCGKFHEQVEPRIIQEYVSSGKVRFIYRDFAFLDSIGGNDSGESHMAAEAARCAGDQGKFWEYHTYLYKHQNGENQGAFSNQNLKKFAAALSLDTATFNACLDSRKHQAAVVKDTADGRELGVNGTPGTFVNGELIQGALPYENFKAAIEAALR